MAANSLKSSRSGWAGLALLGLLGGAANGDASQLLLQQTSLIGGEASETLSLTAPTAGVVTLQLTDLSWPTQLSSLSFMANTPTQLLASGTVAGGGLTAASASPSLTQSFNVGAGSFFAQVTGQATGALDLGLYSLSITFAPSSAVPLPSSFWLLLSSLAALAGAIPIRISPWTGRRAIGPIAG